MGLFSFIKEAGAKIFGGSAQAATSEKLKEEVKGHGFDADKLGIEVSDDQVKELIREQAEAAGEDPDQVIEDLWQHGRQEDLREDLRLRAALDRVAAEVKPIPLEQAQARDAIWTPDKESPEQETKLWTPGN